MYLWVPDFGILLKTSSWLSWTKMAQYFWRLEAVKEVKAMPFLKMHKDKHP